MIFFPMRILLEQIFLMDVNTLSLIAAIYSRLLIIFVNSLNPDQDRQNVGPDLDPKCLTLL